MEKDATKALLVVCIDNANRLNADSTEDYFLVDAKDYRKAVRVLRESEEAPELNVHVENTSSAMAILNNAQIDYEHVFEGRKFFFGNVVDMSECDRE